jgi:hypothetical protein
MTAGHNPVRVPLTPTEVATRIGELLADAEKQMNIAVPQGASEADRMKAIVDSGEAMPPALYEIWSKVTFDGKRH